MLESPPSPVKDCANLKSALSWLRIRHLLLLPAVPVHPTKNVI